MVCNPPPLAQAQPQSQKSGQNGGSMPTPCLDKAVHARDTCDSKARAGLEPYMKHGTMHKQLSKHSACPDSLSGASRASGSNGCSCPHAERDQ